MSDEAAANQGGAILKLVDTYIKLRDTKAEIVNRAKEKASKVDAAMSKIEGLLLKHFEAQGIDNIKTGAGTAYRSTRTSATVADWDQVLEFVVGNSLWSMLERRVSKDFVAQYKAESGELPPGVNWREENIINVRRPQS